MSTENATYKVSVINNFVNKIEDTTLPAIIDIIKSEKYKPNVAKNSTGNC